MRPRTQRSRLTAISLCGAVIAALAMLIAAETNAFERSGPSGDSGEETPKGPPCAVIDKFGGDLQILDATRTKLEDPRRGGSIGCGGWISVSKGWVQLKHQGGALIRLGSESFARLRDGDDQLILHRGEVHVTGGHGRGGLKVITPNARATISRGSALVIYSPEEEESQLISLESSAKIENRFAPQHPITVGAGEGSSLNFKLLRVVPSAPRAVSIAAIRKHLIDLKLEGRGRDVAITSVQKRLDRKFASKHPIPKDADEKPKRAPASEQKRYARHPSSDDEFIRRTMNRKVAGDEQGGDAVLHPTRPVLKGKAQVVDLEPAERVSEEEAHEKQRLIEELSRIKED